MLLSILAKTDVTNQSLMLFLGVYDLVPICFWVQNLKSMGILLYVEHLDLVSRFLKD